MKKSLAGVVLACGLALGLEARAVETAPLRVSMLALDDDLESSDFGTGVHLGWRLRSPELASGLRAEAELSVLLSASNQGGLSFRDNASFVRLSWRPPSWSEGEGLALTVLPLSSRRLALGYEFPASWGRDVYGRGTTSGGVPGLELRLARERWYVFSAAKSTLAVNESTQQGERLSLLMAGAGADVLPVLRVEAAGTLVDHGAFPRLTPLEGREERARTVGVSGRLLYQQGAPIGPSVDFTLYQADPEVFEKLLAPEAYPGGVSASVSLEATHLAQALEDPLSTTPRTVSQGADALALQARLKVDGLRVHALALYRSASFVSAELPGYPRFRAFPEGLPTRPELLASAGVDHHFSGPRLTPGLVFRALWPATLGPSENNVLGSPTQPSWVVVRRGVTDSSLLPEGLERRPILTAKATLRWDFGDSVSALGEAGWTSDPNRFTLVSGPTGLPELKQERASALGFAALLQARF